MDFQVKEGTDINLILKILDLTFPKCMELEKLKKEFERKRNILELEKYLVYLEDKNWIRKEGDKFRITAYGLDIYHEIKT